MKPDEAARGDGSVGLILGPAAGLLSNPASSKHLGQRSAGDPAGISLPHWGQSGDSVMAVFLACVCLYPTLKQIAKNVTPISGDIGLLPCEHLEETSDFVVHVARFGDGLGYLLA